MFSNWKKKPSNDIEYNITFPTVQCESNLNIFSLFMYNLVLTIMDKLKHKNICKKKNSSTFY